MCVVTKALPASPLAARALPALKPNQPNQSRPAPSTANGRLCGGEERPTRLPSSRAETSAAMPALMCTTVPPAKSSAPAVGLPAASLRDRNPPRPHTQCATGSYTNVAQSTMKRQKAENFMRSANAPRINAGVITANIAWKIMNTECGMVAEYPANGSPPTCRRKAQSRLPMIPLTSGPKARL